jgi:hypothetical protein
MPRPSSEVSHSSGEGTDDDDGTGNLDAWPQQAQELGDAPAQILALHDHVHHAVLHQELGALEALGQLLADGLLDHPRSGEPDQGLGLGDDHVAQHGEAGGHAAGGGVEQHRDVGQRGRLAAPQRRRGLGHLHQREDALLHARPAGRGQQDAGAAVLQRPLEHAGDLLAHHRAHAAAHEAELEDAEGHRQALDASHAGAQRIVEAGRLLRRLQAVLVLLGVLEAQGVDGLQLLVGLHEAVLVEQEVDPAVGAERVVVAAARADPGVALDLLVVEDLGAALALAPHPLGDGALLVGIDVGTLANPPGHGARAPVLPVLQRSP